MLIPSTSSRSQTDSSMQVLFWEDGATRKTAEETHKASAHMFGQWGEHSDAMAQIQVCSCKT